MQTLAWFLLWFTSEKGTSFWVSTRIFSSLETLSIQSISEKMSVSIIFYFFLIPRAAWYTLTVFIVMALLCPLRLSLQQGQQASQLKWPHISQRVLTVFECLSGCVPSDWLWLISHCPMVATGSHRTPHAVSPNRTTTWQEIIFQSHWNVTAHNSHITQTTTCTYILLLR